jgi:hypothetical protein
VIEKLVSYISNLQNFLIKINYLVDNIYFQEPGVSISINSLRNNNILFVLLRETDEEIEIYDTTYIVLRLNNQESFQEIIDKKDPDVCINKLDFVEDVFIKSILKLIGNYDDRYNISYYFVNEVVNICKNNLTIEPVIFGTDILLEEFKIKLSTIVRRVNPSEFLGTIYVPGHYDEIRLDLKLEETEPWVKAGLIMDFILKLITSDDLDRLR